MPFIEVRSPVTKKLLFRYDPERQLIEVRERPDVSDGRGHRKQEHVITLVDLSQYAGETTSK